LDKVGGIAKAHGDFEKALSHYEESLAIARALAEELGTPESRRDVSIRLNNVGDIAKSKGDLGTALAHYEESLAIRRTLAEELNTPQGRRDLVARLYKLVEIVYPTGDFEKAVAYNREALTIARAWPSEIDLVECIAALAWSTSALSGKQLEQGNAFEFERLHAEWRDLVGELEALDINTSLYQASTQWECGIELATEHGRVIEARACEARMRAVDDRIKAKKEAKGGE
jgi:tetratricopeptide (TPR) repeat protein